MINDSGSRSSRSTSSSRRSFGSRPRRGPAAAWNDLDDCCCPFVELVAQIMIHQAMGGAQGQAEDIKAHKHTSVVGVTGAVRCLSD